MCTADHSDAIYILCLVITFRPRFLSDYLSSSVIALSKRSPVDTDVSHINTLNCLPPLSATTSRGFPPLSWAVFNFAQQLGAFPPGILNHKTEQHVRGFLFKKRHQNSSNWVVASWQSTFAP